jgi:hypothetical protein
MNRRGALLILVVLLGAGACGPLRYKYVPTTANKAAARAAGCSFEILTTRPDRPFIELGVLELDDGRTTQSVGQYRTAVAQDVCAVGGDAVLAEINGNAFYVRGTVIKYQAATAAASP